MTADQYLITSETPTSPHLSRMAWLAEQLIQTAGEMAYLFHDDAVTRDLTGAEFDAFRQAAAAARTAGGDVLLVVSAAHQRGLATDEIGPR
jgi:sulfur relay (sulfurtransferase) complex TusBCD TusD component (DsrE family)